MAKRTTQTAEKVGGGGGADRIKTPGWHHVHITHCDDVTKDNKPVEGLFTEFAAFDGPDAGKVFSMCFFDPKDGDADMPEDSTERKRYEINKRKQTALLVASGLMTEAQMGSPVDYDSADAVNRQCVIHLDPDNQEKNAGKGYLQLAWDDIYHIDDPRVADLVKAKKLVLSSNALGVYPKEFRRDPKSFDLEKLGGKKAASNANGNGSHAAGSSSSKPASAAVTSGVNLDDV
jgi:hypothetical protein